MIKSYTSLPGIKENVVASFVIDNSKMVTNDDFSKLKTFIATHIKSYGDTFLNSTLKLIHYGDKKSIREQVFEIGTQIEKVVYAINQLKRYEEDVSLEQLLEYINRQSHVDDRERIITFYLQERPHDLNTAKLNQTVKLIKRTGNKILIVSLGGINSNIGSISTKPENNIILSNRGELPNFFGVVEKIIADFISEILYYLCFIKLLEYKTCGSS